MSYKTRICKNGKNCRFAQSGKCTYAHPELGDKMPDRPERPATRMPFQPDQGRTKTRLCTNYPDCKFAERCSFIHPNDLDVVNQSKRKRAPSDASDYSWGSQEQPVRKMPFQPSLGRAKTVLCDKYPNCRFAERCSFIHPDETNVKPSNLEVRDEAMRKQTTTDDASETSFNSSTTDESIQDAVPEDFWSIEKLREAYAESDAEKANGYMGEWYDCSVKPNYHCRYTPTLCC